ncbi:hypothetical protein PybrP1_002465 [[Pythium] brassicae (nom. inval.)]|nr:hypothetical protein PybrP1_002465 [[Pythium] brassicae (nom. inval.)]
MLSSLLPAPKRATLLAGALAAVTLAHSADAMFRFDCHNNLVVDRVDPITSPGTESMHLHAISGGNGFSWNADYEAMREKSTCTSCPIGADLSAYWVPQLYVKYKNGTGFGLVESHQIVYYQPRGSKNEEIIAFPPGLKMLAGDPDLRTGSNKIEQRAVTWQCINYKDPVPEQQGFPSVKCPQGLRGQVNFPMCWNGKDLDSPDHKSHVAYAENLDSGKCPTGYKKMVKIFYEAFYSVDKYDSEWVDDKHPFVLSNGDTTGYSFHGDFLNGWDVDVLQAAIDKCSDKNYFNPAECPPLAPTYSSKPPATRCTLQPQVKEETHNIRKLPGNNPVGVAPAPSVSGGDDDGDDNESGNEYNSDTPKPTATTKPAATTTSKPAATTAKPAATELAKSDKPVKCGVKAPKTITPSSVSGY